MTLSVFLKVSSQTQKILRFSETTVLILIDILYLKKIMIFSVVIHYENCESSFADILFDGNFTPIKNNETENFSRTKSSKE